MTIGVEGLATAQGIAHRAGNVYACSVAASQQSAPAPKPRRRWGLGFGGDR
jgi:hypothetical protein